MVQELGPGAFLLAIASIDFFGEGKEGSNRYEQALGVHKALPLP